MDCGCAFKKKNINKTIILSRHPKFYDGLHIVCLKLTFFFILFKGMIKLRVHFHPIFDWIGLA